MKRAILMMVLLSCNHFVMLKGCLGRGKAILKGWNGGCIGGRGARPLRGTRTRGGVAVVLVGEAQPGQQQMKTPQGIS